jgi:acetyltransferase-like isoleucine patch superfamily enzyme
MNYKALATSDHWFPRMLRWGRRAVKHFNVPAPRALTIPLLYTVLAVRAVYYFIARVFVCEPLFKAYCASYGRNVHTGVFLHWVQGRGDLIVGDDVIVDGKCDFSFAARFSNRPTLIIDSNTVIGHGCSFVIGKQISIGRHCLIAGSVRIIDSPGHPTDPVARQAGAPATDDEVRPVVIEDNVWIGFRSVVMPGVTIGRNSVVAVGSVVTTDVPPNTLVLGNPARKFPLIRSKE